VRGLSTKRRHPLAGAVVVLLGLCLLGGLYSLFAPRTADADTTSQDLVEEGRQLFLVGCASCHGLNGEGVLTASGNNYGPSLVGVGAASVHFQVGTGRMPMAQNSEQAPDKPVVYTPEEIEALAAYVASLGPGPGIPDEEYTTASTDPEVIARGGEIFRTNCTACHNSGGTGGALPDGRWAPAINDVEGVYIYEAMITGPQQMPVFSDQVITPEDKRAIISYIHNLREQPEYGGHPLGSLGPVTEGAAAWIIGMGSLVAASVWIGTQGVRAKK
jgi:ubiquinol-cytochrome c reductase cytochrome c subunit